MPDPYISEEDRIDVIGRLTARLDDAGAETLREQAVAQAEAIPDPLTPLKPVKDEGEKDQKDVKDEGEKDGEKDQKEFKDEGEKDQKDSKDEGEKDDKETKEVKDEGEKDEKDFKDGKDGEKDGEKDNKDHKDGDEKDLPKDDPKEGIFEGPDDPSTTSPEAERPDPTGPMM